MIRASQLDVPESLTKELFDERKCHVGIHRATPLNVSCWLSRYNGEMVAVGICYLVLDSHPDVEGRKSPSLIMFGRSPRYTNWSLIPRVSGKCVLCNFPNDWFRALGRLRRILLDSGGHGIRNRLWADAIHTFGRQLAPAPPNIQSQDGLAEREVWALKVAVRNILAPESQPKLNKGS